MGLNVKEVSMEKFKLPAGKYYIGDPCYVIHHRAWVKVCDNTDDKVINCLEHPFFMAGTAYGDGVYFDQNNREYDVDSGCLGAVPVALIQKPLGAFMMIIDFPDGLVIGYDGKVFMFGSLTIDTDPQEDFEQDDEND